METDFHSHKAETLGSLHSASGPHAEAREGGKHEVQDQQGMLFLLLKGNDHWMAQGFVICKTGLLSLPCAAGLLSPRWGVNPDTQTESISADKYSPNESAVLAPGCQVARCGCNAFAPVAGAVGLFPPYYPPRQGTDEEKGQWTRDPTLLPSWMRQLKSLSGLRLHEAQLSGKYGRCKTQFLRRQPVLSLLRALAYARQLPGLALAHATTAPGRLQQDKGRLGVCSVASEPPIFSAGG